MNNSVFFFTFLGTKGNIHRGELLESVVRSRAVNISQLVKRMGISRGTYYNDKSNRDLSYDKLLKYGKVLNYDFTLDFPVMKRIMLEEQEHPYKKPKNLNEALEQIDYWKDKYYKLMEKYLAEKP